LFICSNGWIFYYRKFFISHHLNAESFHALSNQAISPTPGIENVNPSPEKYHFCDSELLDETPEKYLSLGL
jgi:hypothetical protein